MDLGSQAVKNYAPRHQTTYDSTNKMTIDDHDNWCQEYLRFTDAEIKEIADRLVSCNAAQDARLLWSFIPRFIVSY
jgi:hypothetical protein